MELMPSEKKSVMFMALSDWETGKKCRLPNTKLALFLRSLPIREVRKLK